MLRRLIMGFMSVVLTLTGLALISVVWILYSESGTRWSIEQATGLTAAVIEVRDVTGSFSSGLRAEHVRYADSSMEIRVADAQLAFDLPRLLLGEIHIAKMRLDAVNYLSLSDPANKPPDPDGEISLPIRLTISAATVSRLGLRLGGAAEEEFENVRLALTWLDSRIDITTISMTAFGAQISGNAGILLTKSLTLAANLKWSLLLPDELSLQGMGAINGDLNRLVVRHELDKPFPVKTAGSIYLSGIPRVELTNTSEQIDYVVAGRELRLSDTEIKLTGWLDGFKFDLKSGLETDGLPPTMIEGGGAGDTSALRFDSLRADANGSAVIVDGDLAWADDINWQLDIELQELNPALLQPGWDGKLGGNFGFLGNWSENKLVYDLNDISITGYLRDQPVDLKGQIRQAEGLLRFEAMRLKSGTNRLAFDGSYGERLAATYDADLRNLSEFGSGWNGSVKGRGSLGGSFERPEIKLDADARELRIPGYAVGQLTATGQFMPSGPPSELTITATDIELGEQKLNRAELRLQGNLIDHELRLAAGNSTVSADALFSGGWSETLWTGKLLDSSLDPKQTGPWKQTLEADLSVSTEQAQFTEVCWQKTGSTACIQGTAGVRQLAVIGRLQNLALDLLAAWLPGGAQVTGNTNADLNLSGTMEAPSLEFAANAPGIDLAYESSEDEESISTSVRDLRLAGTANLKQIDIDLTIAGLNDDGKLTLTGQLANWTGSAPRVQANLQASIPDASFLSLVSTQLTETAGSLVADLTLSGSLAAPTVIGDVRLSNGRAYLRNAGITLEDIEIEARPIGRSALEIEGAARSGEGQVEVAGRVELDRVAGWPIAATIRGDNFTAIDIPELEAVVSPDLDVTGTATNLLVRGKVVTPRVIVQLRELPKQAIEVSPDAVVYRSTEVAIKPEVRFQIDTDLLVELGEEVSFSGFGLRSQLGGQLTIRTVRGRPAEGRGVVTIKSGDFKAYGQDLKISNGRLVFAGPLDDPALFVEAVRKIDPVTVGVRVGGTGQTPVATIFSRPAMSEANALSYLVIGRPLAEASGSQGAELKNAALALGLKQAVPVADEIGRSVGLDELGLDTEDSTGGAVMAGKQLTRDLYVRYSYGLFNSIGALLLRYRLSNSLNLEARSAEDQSMDLIYTRERE